MIHDEETNRLLRDKYFSLMIISLFERWFIVETPRRRLEDLVLSFQDSDILLIGDGYLAPRIAGITEIYDRAVPVDLSEYRTDIRYQTWLADYVSVLLEHELMRRAVL